MNLKPDEEKLLSEVENMVYGKSDSRPTVYHLIACLIKIKMLEREIILKDANIKINP